jgi:hypothetical protein
MEFKRKGPNVAEITTRDGRRILFSYGEPVAVLYPAPLSGRAHAVVKRVDSYVSRTTEQHIEEFAKADAAQVKRVPVAEVRRITAEAA